MNDQQINELVAEHVLGWKRGDGSITSDPEGPYPELAFLHKWTTDKGRPEDLTPEACTDGNVMLRVIEAMMVKGVDEGGDGFQVDSMIWTGSAWVVKFDFCEGTGRDYYMPRAVAVAALKALRILEEKRGGKLGEVEK